MNKLITKIVGVFLGLSMAAGAGVAVASNSKGFEPARAAIGDEITSVSNIVSGAGYYIKGVRNINKVPTTKYFKINSTTDASTSGTEVDSTASATQIVFLATSTTNVFNLKLSNGRYIGLGTSNGSMTTSDSPINLNLSNINSKIRISNSGNTRSLQKNSSAAAFGSYANTQNDVTLIVATLPSKTVDHIEIANDSTHQVNFETGDSFSYTGLKVNVCYKEAVPAELLTVTTDYTVSSPNMASAGDKTVTITPTAGGKAKGAASITYTIHVTDPLVLDTISLTGTVSAKLGSAWDLTNVVVTGTSTTGSTGDMGDITADCSITAITAVPNYLKRSMPVYLSVSYKSGEAITSEYVDGRVYDINETSNYLEFKNNGSDSNTAVDTDTILDEIKDNSSSYVSSCTATSNTYPGNGGLKLGKSNAKGSFTLSLSSSGQAIAAKGARVVAKIKGYGTDGTSIKITIGTQNETVAAPSDYEEADFFEINQNSVSSIKVETVGGNRGYIAYISFITEEIVEETYVTSLTMNDGSSNHTSNFNMNCTEQTGYSFTAFVDNAASDKNIIWSTTGNITGSNGSYVIGAYASGSEATVTATSSGTNSLGNHLSITATISIQETSKLLDSISWVQNGYDVFVGDEFDVTDLTATITASYVDEYDEPQGTETKQLPINSLGLYSSQSSESLVRTLTDGDSWLSTDNHYIGVSYTEGGRTRYAFSSTKMCVVATLKSVKEQQQSTVFTQVNSIAIGDVITFVNIENSKYVDSYNSNNKYLAVEDYSSYITTAMEFTVGKDGDYFTFQNADGYLGCHSSGTTGNNYAYIDAEYSSTYDRFEVSFDESDNAIITSVYSDDRALYYKDDTTRFAFYGQAYKEVQIFKKGEGFIPTETEYANVDAIQQKAALDFISIYNQTVGAICLQSTGGTTDKNALKAAWGYVSDGNNQSLAAKFEDASSAGSNFINLFKYGKAVAYDDDPLRAMLASYNFIFETYGEELHLIDFLNTVANRPNAPTSYSKITSIISNTNQNVLLVVSIIAVAGLTSIGGYFLLRKKKEER